MGSAMLGVVATGARHPLGEQRAYVIGRATDAEIQVRDDTVGRRHARVSWNGEAWVVEDLGSSGGTFVRRPPARSGDHLRGRFALRDGDELSVGAAALRFSQPRRTAPRPS